MNLQELIADSKLRAGQKKPRRTRPEKDSFALTKEELRKLKLEQCVPQSIHLRLVQQICECGNKMTVINQGPLVKKVSPSLTHFEYHEDIHKDDYAALPRFIEVSQMDVMYCEDCFVNAHYVEVPREKATT